MSEADDLHTAQANMVPTVSGAMEHHAMPDISPAGSVRIFNETGFPLAIFGGGIGGNISTLRIRLPEGAVNQHEALVGALRRLVVLHGNDGRCECFDPQYDPCCWCEARAALGRLAAEEAHRTGVRPAPGGVVQPHGAQRRPKED